ncbi:hypothetical protein [Candidatus Poriferisocius sp.]|uniref:hypothetical protein n=1 Tax=Candidatus Poriferisocius sp. TaxID=3101276 RepID=UPI003B52918D
MEHLVSASFEVGNTVVVICPHGDLATRAATIADAHQVHFSAADFSDHEHPPRWNLCEPPTGVTPTQWAAELVHIIRAAWSDMPKEYFGPVWDKNMRVGLTVLTRDPRGPHPLSKLASVLLPPIQDEWVKALGRICDSHLERELHELHRAATNDSEGSWWTWCTSKLEPFTADDRMKRVIDHCTSTIDLTRVLDGESLIVSAPASALGDQGANLMMGTILNQLWHFARLRTNPGQTIDLFVDEVHRIPPKVLSELLAEGRKFGIRLRLTTQSPNQLAPEARNAALNNSGAVGTFRTGPSEAQFLEPMFPTISPGTLNRLSRHWLAITDGEDELIGPTIPPSVDPDDRSAIHAAHLDRHTALELKLAGLA